ncbi:MAG: stage V sporulation protein G [Pseudohongiellaceae bacterium]
MEITDVRVKLAENQQERLLAFCTVTFGLGFVVRDVKVIEGLKGPFIAMPSRKVTGRCHKCGEKNHLKAHFCNNCGRKLDPPQALDDGRGRPRLYVDIAHPINQKCRTLIEDSCIAAYREELQRSQQPGYVPHDLDDFDESKAPRAPTNQPSSAPAAHDDGGQHGDSHTPPPSDQHEKGASAS